MRKRRYALDEFSGSIAVLALKIAIEELDKTNNNEPYLKWQKANMELLKIKLENYQWEVQENDNCR